MKKILKLEKFNNLLVIEFFEPKDLADFLERYKNNILKQNLNGREWYFLMNRDLDEMIKEIKEIYKDS